MNANPGGGFDLDDLLDRELQGRVGGLQGPHPAVSQSAYHAFATGGTTMSLFSSLGALASTKAAAGLAVAALAVGGGAVTATAVTGSTDPGVWGQTVTATVEACKDNLTDGKHGIGQCVSAVAKTNGPAERAEHSQASHARTASEARTNHPDAKPSDHPGGKPSDHPTPR